MAFKIKAGPFRGLTPYLEEDHDLFFGRDKEKAALLELFTSPRAPVVLVTGEVGVGKTSLLRAGLIPKLHPNWTTIYLECAPDWRRDFCSTLSGGLNRQVNIQNIKAAYEQMIKERALPLALFLDHVEHLLWFENEDVQEISELLSTTLQQRGFIVFGVDQGFDHAWEKLLTYVPQAANYQRVIVDRWARQTVGQVLEQTVLAGGGYLEQALPELMAEELTAEGPIPPALMQMLGHAAIIERAIRVKAYNRAGGALALTNLYVERLVKRAGGWRGRRILAALSEHPDPRHSLKASSIAQTCGLPLVETTTILSNLEHEGLVSQKVDPLAIKSEPTFTVIHPFIIQSVRDIAAPVHRGKTRAKIALKKRIHGGGILRPEEIYRVGRYLGDALTTPEKELLQRGIRIWTLLLGAALALPVLGYIVVLYLSSASSFLAEAPAFPGKPRIVVRSGRPSLNSLTHSFGGIEIDTGFLLPSLPSGLKNKIKQHTIVGNSANPTPPQIPYWLKQISAPLQKVRKGALYILAGDLATGGSQLEQAAATPKTRRKATWALALLSGDSQATLSALSLCMKDSRPEVRRMAVAETQRINAKRSLAVLSQAIQDRDPLIRLEALRALRRNDFDDSLPLLSRCLLDQDPRIQKEVLDQLTLAAKRKPVFVFSTVSSALDKHQDRIDHLRIPLEHLLLQIQKSSPNALVEHLVKVAVASKNSRFRVDALTRLASMSKNIKAEKMLPKLKPLLGHSDPQIRSAVIPLQAQFGNPEEEEDRLIAMAETFQPKGEAVAMRRAAAIGLGLIPKKPSYDRLKTLKHLLKDTREVRTAAMEALIKLDRYGLVEVVKGIKKGRDDLALTALNTICKGTKINPRVATSIIATVWKKESDQLRKRSLECAKNLVTYNTRLSLWLADQARLEKNLALKRTAASVVAAALKHDGERAKLLAKYYSRQKDTPIVIDFLKALSKQSLPPNEALFKMLQPLTKHTDPKVRVGAVHLLVAAAPKPEMVIPYLEKLLQDPDEQVVHAAMKAALLLKPTATAKNLDPILERTLSSARSKTALEALAVAKKLKLSKTIRKASIHAEPEVRGASLDLIAKDADKKEALEVLEAAWRDNEPTIRLAALRALANQGPRLGVQAVKLLKKGTTSTSPAERLEAFTSLGKIVHQGKEDAVALAATLGKNPSEDTRSLAMRTLTNLAPHSQTAAFALFAGVQDPAYDVRRAAQAGLAQFLGKFCSLDILIELLQKSERNAQLRHIACASIAWFGRYHGTKALRGVRPKLTQTLPLILKMSLNLAASLATRSDPPEEVIGWLFGW